MSNYITTEDRSYDGRNKIVHVFIRGLAEQLERKGFEIIYTAPEWEKPKFTLYGDYRKITKREEPYIEKHGELQMTNKRRWNNG